jgi:peptidoglycan hydrolase CwlO-like protein
MNIQDQIWTIQNKIHELRLSIATEEVKDYKGLYTELYQLEQELEKLNNECD